MYNFLFDKKSLMLLLAGLGLSGALLFFAGLLVGVQVGLPPASGAVAVQAPQRRERPEPPEPPAKPAPASLPADCVCPPATETTVVARMEPCPEPAPAEPRVAEPVAVEEPAVMASLPVSEPEGEPEPIAETIAGEVQPAAFSIQVGAFRSPENSARALEELRNRGYEPYVVERPGSRNRVLHTVRVGRYADRAEALQAAADFRRRERMAAIVERVGS